MTQVQIIAWNPGALAIPVVQAVREHTGLGLRDAKALIDASLEGQPISVPCPNAQAAEALRDALYRLNLKVSLQPLEPP